MGPRIISTGNSVGQWIKFPSRSLITGCRQSGSWARALLHDVLGRMARGFPQAAPGVHVDDISQIAACGDGRKAVEWLAGSAAILCDGAWELGLRISANTAVLPKGPPPRSSLGAIFPQGWDTRKAGTTRERPWD